MFENGSRLKALYINSYRVIINNLSLTNINQMRSTILCYENIYVSKGLHKANQTRFTY